MNRGVFLESTVKVPLELLRQVDILVERLDFRRRETFVEAAIRRLLDHYALTLPPTKRIAN
jgi:metal-responsive CopG/Arc/MetJ family transcriptional regulator